jgi:RNA polymerase sigma-32 factor
MNLDKEKLVPIVTPPGKELATPYAQRTAFEIYLKEIQKYDLLTEEQERILTNILYETGDIEIAKKLVLANLRLVVKMAMEYRFAYSNIMDLIQEGNLGLMKAISNYNPNKGAKLSYYASWWIKSYILKFILDNFRLIKIGTTNDQKKLFYNLLKEKDRLHQLGMAVNDKTISESLGVSEKAVALMNERLSSGGKEVSIDSERYNDGSGVTFADVIADDAVAIEDELSNKESMAIFEANLQEFLGALKERDRDIFTGRLLSEIPLTLQELADKYGVTRERIRQIEERLINSFKKFMSKYLT